MAWRNTPAQRALSQEAPAFQDPRAAPHQGFQWLICACGSLKKVNAFTWNHGMWPSAWWSEVGSKGGKEDASLRLHPLPGLTPTLY